MKGYERNYDFADLVSCASGLNRIASMEYGEENIRLGRSHAKQQTIWGKLHPLLAGEVELDLSDFSRLCNDAEITEALKKGLEEAQSLLIQLNMAPHTGVRNPVWWKTPWITERELGLFEMSVEVSPESCELELEEGHETKHVMSEVFHELCSDEQEVKKFDPMVSYDGHSIYKATLVSQLVGNPMLSKDRLTRIKQSIYFNGVKQKPRVDGVPVCILDIGSDCDVFFKSENTRRSTRSNKRRTANSLTNEVWIGRVQKIRRKYNGKWGKTRTEVDLLDRPVGTSGEGCICQVLFNWYTPIRNSREKFSYDNTDLQWIDIESVITVVRMIVEHNVRTVWCLDSNDRQRIDKFMQSC
ncbi:hypothetical protein R1sor_020005 [Riccia sorocarpa]|uniref:Uncharacterized protein n=1 Tax=Riccia sorocarpa TaxID=122646 RepID=A0ABD3IE41_9MARC